MEVVKIGCTLGIINMQKSAQTEALVEPKKQDIRLEVVLHALADPIRMQIVSQLAHSKIEMSCSCFHLPISKSTITHHFKVLREAGIISQYYKGTSRLSVLRAQELQALFPGLLESILKAYSNQSKIQTIHTIS